MKELTETLKKQKSSKNSDYQRQVYKKYCSDRQSEKAYINATIEMYAKVSELFKTRLELKRLKDGINKNLQILNDYEKNFNLKNTKK